MLYFFSIRNIQKTYKNLIIFSRCLLFFHYLTFSRPTYTMVHPLPVELQNSIKSLLLQNTPFYIIRKDYPPVLLSTLTHYKKKLLSSATLLAGRRPSFVSVSTRQYIAKMLRNGKQNGPKTFQEYLRLIEIDVSMSVVRNLLKRMDFKQRRKIKTNFISKKKQSSSAGMGQKTPASYGRPVEAVGVF